MIERGEGSGGGGKKWSCFGGKKSKDIWGQEELGGGRGGQEELGGGGGGSGVGDFIRTAYTASEEGE